MERSLQNVLPCLPIDCVVAEPLILLAFLALLLLAVAVVGHGLWVFAGAFWKALTDDIEEPGSVKCPKCGRVNPPHTHRCHWCENAIDPLLANELADLDATRRQLRRMQDAGALKPGTAERLLTRLADYRRQRVRSQFDSPPLPVASLSESPVETAPVPEPPPTPTTPPPNQAKPRTSAPPAEAVLWAEVLEPEPASEPTVASSQAAAESYLRTGTDLPAGSEPKHEGPWQDTVGRFLAEREIHWAEMIGVLVGGFIMVGSSVALVVNLWQTLEHTPYMKFLIFVAYTSLVFAAGLYAFHRWKLRSTGSGLLTIGILSVPLNFLAMASLWRSGLDTTAIVAETVAWLLFVVLIRLASGVLTPQGRWLGPLAVAGNSAAILGMARFVHAGQPAWLLEGAPYVPVALFAAVAGGYLWRMPTKARLAPPDAAALLNLLGTSAFSMCVALGLYLSQAARVLGDGNAVLQLLAIPAALAAVPVLAVGARLMGTRASGDMPRTPASGHETTVASYQAVGTLLVLLAIVLQIASLGFAWPQPQPIVVAGLLNAAGLVLVAFRYRFPAAHAGAMACVALSYLVGFHWTVGNLAGVSETALQATLLRLAITAQSGTALTGLFVAFGFASFLLARMRDSRHGQAYAVGAAAVAVAGLVLVSYHGMVAGGTNAIRAAVLYAVYGAGSCILAAQRRDRGLAYLAVTLGAAAPLWAFWATTGAITPALATLLAGEAMFCGSLLCYRLATNREMLIRTIHGAVSLEKCQPWAPACGIEIFRQPLWAVSELLGLASMVVWLMTSLQHPDAIGYACAPVATMGLLTVFYFARTWLGGSGVYTWLGSLVLLAGFTHTLVLNFEGLVQEPWLIALLTHATFALTTALAVDGVAASQGKALYRRLNAWVAEPLANTALLSSTLFVLLLPGIYHANWACCSGLFWLAAIWLAFALRHGNHAVFAAHQAALAAGAVAETALWLRNRGVDLEADWFLPANLQVFGLAVAAVMLPWPALRLIQRQLGNASKGCHSVHQHRGRHLLARVAENGNRLLDVPRSLDSLLRHVLVVLQLLISVLWLTPEIAREIGMPAGAVEQGVLGIGAGTSWLLLGLLAAGLVLEMWDRWGTAQLWSMLVLLATIPWLLAAQGIGDVGVASLVRWTTALYFLAIAVAVWCRGRIGRLAKTLRVRWKSEGDITADLLARTVSLVFGLLPVLVITLLVIALRMDSVTARGPLAESLLFGLGYRASHLIPLILLAVTLIGYALRERSAGYALASCLMANVASLVLWQMPGIPDFRELLLTQAMAFSLGGALWTLFRLLLPDRASSSLSFGDAKVAPSHLAVLASVGLLVILAGTGAVGDVSGDFHIVVGQADALCLLLVAASVAFCLWDQAARFPLPALYSLVLAAEAFLLGYREFGSREYVWTAAPEFGAAMLLTALVGWVLGRTRQLWRMLGILADAKCWSSEWFHFVQAILGLIVGALGLWAAMDTNNDGVGVGTALLGMDGRWAGPSVAIILLGAVIVMAWQALGSQRRAWQTAAFATGLLLNVTIGLAALDVGPGADGGEAPWLNRCAILLTGTAMLTLLSQFGLRRVLPRCGDWLEVGRDVAPVFATMTAIALPVLLIGEGVRFQPASGAPVAMFSVVAIPVLLLPLAFACLGYAIRAAETYGKTAPVSIGSLSHFVDLPDLAPTTFVYVAEAILAMIGLHLWLCEPQWFRLGLIEQYWMFLVMAVAFAGLGVSEWFHRVKLPVLSEPLRNTALLLPLVPMIGFWSVAPPTSPLDLAGSTPALWLLMALFYGIQAVMNPRSVLLGALTLVTGTIGLWVVLERESLDFFTHPQLWLIPPALAMLVAERLDRPRLGTSQREALRYIALSVIYVASTTEFLRGIGHSVWLPLVLLVLSVAGILAGLALRIRSYVYLGMTFLAVVIVRMIGYAAFEQGQMWLFWVCCILLGASIIALFAVFERRRDAIIAAARKLRQWER